MIQTCPTTFCEALQGAGVLAQSSAYTGLVVVVAGSVMTKDRPQLDAVLAEFPGVTVVKDEPYRRNPRVTTLTFHLDWSARLAAV